MRIKILVSGFPPEYVGGTETQALGISRQLARRHDVTVVTRREKAAAADEEREGFRVRRVWYCRLPVLRFITYLLSVLFFLFRERKRTDVLLCMMLSPNGLAGVVSKKLFGMKTIASVRGGDWYMAGRMAMGINGLVLGSSDLVLVQTETIRKDISTRFPDADVKIRVMPNGVEMQKERARGEGVLFLGNLQQRKGVDYLLRAMKDVDSVLTVAGDGAEKEHLMSLCGTLGLGKKVVFAGKVPVGESTVLMRKHAVFVLPSLVGEGLPNVILEAMSVGLPVVSTKTSGIPDVVKDGRTGILVAPGDARALADAVNRILKDKKLRMKMSGNATEEIRKYSWPAVAKMLEDVMEEACAE